MEIKVRRIHFFCAVLFCHFFALIVSAETFHLSTGSAVEGKLLNPDQDPRTTYEIETSIGKLVLLAKQVRKVVIKPMVLQQYEKSLPKVPNTIDGHLDMAAKCALVNLFEQRDFHLLEVLRIDPDNTMVRGKLGFVKINGQWRKEDVLMRQQGFVRDGGRWRTRQELTVKQANEDVEDAEIQWRIKIMRWESIILHNPAKASVAIASIRAIKDYRATKTLAERLNQVKLSRDIKFMYLEVLIAIGGNVPVEAMLKCISMDSDEALRQRCLNQLRKWQSRSAMFFFISLLNATDNQTVNNGGYALGELAMADALLPLIKALRTRHTYTIGGGNNINANFSPNQPGLGGMNFGGKPKVVDQYLINRSVHSAILTIVPEGVNFGYDQDRWMQWYIRLNTPQNINLRRAAQN
jgi:hypothetical protein|tara:strand:- start:1120 stop:2343 length:1224 start_codon:yes stop_codon:yes gene_type:complete